MVVELEEQTHAALQALRAQADARQMSLAEYLQLLVDAAHAASGVEPTLEEFDSLLEQVSEGLPLLERLPLDFSRTDIYVGHD